MQLFSSLLHDLISSQKMMFACTEYHLARPEEHFYEFHVKF